jgi:hypothetical protein
VQGEAPCLETLLPCRHRLIRLPPRAVVLPPLLALAIGLVVGRALVVLESARLGVIASR